jgi:hypothetical protein
LQVRQELPSHHYLPTLLPAVPADLQLLRHLLLQVVIHRLPQPAAAAVAVPAAELPASCHLLHCLLLQAAH